MSAGNFCQREVDLAEPDESVLAAAERMRQRTVGCLVVINAAREPIGILTDRDLVIRVLAEGKDRYGTRVEEIMTPGPKTVSESADIEDALRLMRSGAFRRLPVIDCDGKLAGLLTLDDVLMLLAEEFSTAGEVLQRETPRAVAAPAGMRAR